MDFLELRPASKKKSALATSRPPLVPTERNNAVPSACRPRAREVSSRYMSPTPQRRCPSPNPTRISTAATQSVSKRAQSAERKHPSTPHRPKSPSTSQRSKIPSTPVHSASVDMQLSSKRISGRLPEGLWPSTMRSLSVSFQSDSISIPISKKQKPVICNTSSDRPLRPSSNVGYKHVETPTLTRKPTPERKRSPLRGKNVSNQLENSKPVDSLPTRLIDQRRWPSTNGGKISLNGMTKSVDFVDKMDRSSVPPGMSTSVSKLRRMPPTDGMVKPLHKSAIDAAEQSTFEESGQIGSKPKSVDDSTLGKPDIYKHLPPISTERSTPINPAARTQSFPSTGLRRPSPSRTPRLPSPTKTSRPSSPTKTSRPPSPNKAFLPSSISRGISPYKSRPSTPPSRAVSPSRIRIPNPPSQSTSSTSVLRFIADIRKGKKDVSYIEDAHQLRLMHNRYLQWRFTNAQTEDLLCVQRERAERKLYNVWETTLELQKSVSRKMIYLQQLNLELKLNVILNEQMAYLDDWALLESDHVSSLSGAAEDLEASTLRLPVTGGARSNIENLKAAISSAVDVMQAMGTSICPLLSRVEEKNHLVSNLAFQAGQEKLMLKECEGLLSMTAALQVEEESLTTHLIQMKQAVEK